MMTGHGSREAWLAARARKLGGSDAGAMLGLSHWKTNQQLWREKRAALDGRPPEAGADSPAMAYGRAAEPLLRGLFALDHPELEVGHAEWASFGSPEYPFAMASLDGWLRERGGGRSGVLEIKTAAPRGMAEWDGRIPDAYYAQVCWYMGVTGFQFAFLRACIRRGFGDGDGRWEVRDYRMERAEIEGDIEYVMEKGREFWRLVEEGREPPLILPPLERGA